MNHFHHSTLALLLHLQVRKKKEAGYSLVVTLASILLLGTLLVTAALVSKVDSSSTNASTDMNSGFYAAEAGLNLRASDVRADFVGFNRPSGDSEASSWEACIDADPNNNGEGDFACDSNITINGQQIVTYVDDVTEEDAVSTPITSGPFEGLNALEYRYDLISVALNSEGSQQSPSSILGMRFKSRLVPVFQFAAFYNDDLSFTIPPSMTINGRVHSNHDIYLNSGSGTLSITGKVTTPGLLYRGEKTVNNDCRATVSIFDGSSQRNLDCGSGSTTRSYNQSELSSWGENIFVDSDSYKLELPEMQNFQMPPDNIITDADAREDYAYWEKADMRVVLQLDNNNNPTGINIVNPNGSINTGATASLNSCAPISTPLRREAANSNLTVTVPPLGVSAVIDNGNDNNYESTDITLSVQSADDFTVGDRITIGNDFDSNVIRAVDEDADTITLSRQLGHAYQTSPIASRNDTVKKSVVSTSDTFYNYREKNGATGFNAGRFIRMLNIDVGEMLNCIDSNVGSNGLMGNKDLEDDTEGGLVWFFAVNGPDSHNNIATDSPNNYGVRLYNASHLASSSSPSKNIQGLTIVSDQAVYTQGHYNSVNKISAAIISDSFNILSTAWQNDDAGSRSYNSSSLQTTDSSTMTKVTSLSSSTSGDWIREASNTIVNAALFTGQDIMGGGNGTSFQNLGDTSNSGGVNNFPRLHEEWNRSTRCDDPTTSATRKACTLTYRGSMVSFGQAQRVNGDFCGSFYDAFGECNIYTPPIRNWSFDTDFEQAQNLPPLTPRAVSLSQELFERDFSYTGSNPDTFYLGLLAQTSIPITSTFKTPFTTAFNL